MMPFDTLYPEVAKRESRAFVVGDHPDLPSDSYVVREFYCTERGCDCRRALLQIHSLARKKVVATINYAFEPPTGRFADEGQMFLDPINPQSELSDALFEMFEEMIEGDREYHDRLVRHYEMWKRVVDDVSHPDHEKARSDVSFGPAFPRREPERREGPKVGVNDPCPCGSGKKFKKCCRR